MVNERTNEKMGKKVSHESLDHKHWAQDIFAENPLEIGRVYSMGLILIFWKTFLRVVRAIHLKLKFIIQRKCGAHLA